MRLLSSSPAMLLGRKGMMDRLSETVLKEDYPITYQVLKKYHDLMQKSGFMHHFVPMKEYNWLGFAELGELRTKLKNLRQARNMFGNVDFDERAEFMKVFGIDELPEDYDVFTAIEIVSSNLTFADKGQRVTEPMSRHSSNLYRDLMWAGNIRHMALSYSNSGSRDYHRMLTPEEGSDDYYTNLMEEWYNMFQKFFHTKKFNPMITSLIGYSNRCDSQISRGTVMRYLTDKYGSESYVDRLYSSMNEDGTIITLLPMSQNELDANKRMDDLRDLTISGVASLISVLTKLWIDDSVEINPLKIAFIDNHLDTDSLKSGRPGTVNLYEKYRTNQYLPAYDASYLEAPRLVDWEEMLNMSGKQTVTNVGAFRLNLNNEAQSSKYPSMYIPVIKDEVYYGMYNIANNVLLLDIPMGEESIDQTIGAMARYPHDDYEEYHKAMKEGLEAFYAMELYDIENPPTTPEEYQEKMFKAIKKLSNSEALMVRQFAQAITGSLGSELQNSQTRLDALNNLINELRAKLLDNTRSRLATQAQYDGLKATLCNVTKQAEEVISDLRNHHMVDDVSFDQTTVIIKTKPIVAYVEGEEAQGYGIEEHNRLIGAIEIKINLKTSNLTFKSLYKPGYVDQYRRGWHGWAGSTGSACVAPHVSTHGSPCLGNSEDTLQELIENFDIVSYLEVCIDFLQSINLEDSAGACFFFWEQCDEDGNIIYTETKSGSQAVGLRSVPVDDEDAFEEFVNDQLTSEDSNYFPWDTDMFHTIYCVECEERIEDEDYVIPSDRDGHAHRGCCMETFDEDGDATGDFVTDSYDGAHFSHYEGYHAWEGKPVAEDDTDRYTYCNGCERLHPASVDCPCGYTEDEEDPLDF